MAQQRSPPTVPQLNSDSMHFEILLIAAFIGGVIYYGIRRYYDSKKENFEKRDN